jgi:Uma2 family endonuclease
MKRSVSSARRTDPTIYPVEEKGGEDILQRWITELLRPLLERYLGEHGVKAFVGADQFIYWKQHDAHRRVAPDVYVLPGVAPGTHVRSWKTWEAGIVPSFALEVVSLDWEKDYAEILPRYAELGVKELVVFDPAWEGRTGRFRWQLHRGLARRGLVRVETTNADRVRSKVLGAWLRVVGEDLEQRVRIATDPAGDVLVPTSEERETAALARVAVLEAELAKRDRRRR